MLKFTKDIDWISLWIEDKKAIINTMHRSMQSDINAGYDPSGACIRSQVVEIASYSKKYEDELLALADMGEEKANRWAFYDLIRRGAIE